MRKALALLDYLNMLRHRPRAYVRRMKAGPPQMALDGLKYGFMLSSFKALRFHNFVELLRALPWYELK